ncbi:hypothetical protein RFI_28631, partial [Reticulomyxa filosa]
YCSEHCWNVLQHNRQLLEQSTMETNNNSQFMLSVYATKSLNRKRKKLPENENENNNNEHSCHQPKNKRQKTEINAPSLEAIPENKEQDTEIEKIATVNNINEEKKNDEVNEENVWKKSRKVRRLYFCANFPTLVITPVKGRMLLSASSLVRFMGLDQNYIRLKVKAHTHSASWRTLYVHLSKEIQTSELEDISKRFNDIHSKQSVRNDAKDGNEVQFVTPKCSIFQKTYSEEAKKKRLEDVNNPDVNRYVLLKNINLRESEKEIISSLEEYKYKIQECKRFKGLPIVKVLMSSAEDVKRILSDNNIFIGYQKVKCEIFDQNRRRPRKSFKQCRKCHGLNHIANECNKKPVCKYCGRINHNSTQCKFKKSPKKYQCVLCKGNHRSDSLICPKTQEIRQKLGIAFTRRENEIINRKKDQNNNQNQKGNHAAAKPKKNPNEQVQTKVQIMNKQKLAPSQQPEHKNNPRNQLESINNFGKQTQTRNINKKDIGNHYSFDSHENDEIAFLRSEVASLKSTINKMNLLLNKLMPFIENKLDNGDSNDFSKNMNSNANDTTDETMDQW